MAPRAHPGFEADLRDAVHYLDLTVTDDMPPPVRADMAAAADLVGETDRGHVELSRAIRRRAIDGPADAIGDLIVRAGALRRFIG